MTSEPIPMLQQAKRWAVNNLTTLRLSASYLAIIMVMSIGFSIVFYNTSSNQLGKQLPPDTTLIRIGPGEGFGEFKSFLRERIDQGRHELMVRLIWLNVLALAGGSGLSYFLARKTLEPIEEAMEAQSRFAADASHELRTPLAAMQAENEVALRNAKLTLPRAKEVLQSNLEETMRLRTLSDTLLKLARTEYTAIQLQDVKISDVVSTAINNVLKQAQSKHINIEDEVAQLSVTSDATTLAQILSILLDNAVKYSNEHSMIRVSAQAHGQHASISIRDQGQGIPAKDLPHIFERFYRADSSRTKQHVEGHGLGLALAAKLVAQLHGEISVESVEGRGSTFTILLPSTLPNI